MRFLLKFFSFLIAVSLVAMLGAYLLLRDANNLKPELETLLSDQSGMDVTLGGDVRWVLLPPVELAMQNVTARQDQQRINVESLRLKVDISAIWQDVNLWRVDALTLDNASITEGERETVVESFNLTDFALATAAPFALQGNHRANAEATPLAFTVDGVLTYTPENETHRQAVQISEANVTTEAAEGVCEIDLKDIPRAHPPLPPETADDILPLATLMQYELIADCTWQRVNLAEETFTDVKTTLTNMGDALNLYIEAPEFFSGQLISEVDVDLHARPIDWHVQPELNDVDSQKLLDWQQQSFQWAALFALHGELTLKGNTPDAFYQSVRADTELDGGQGTLNIARLKQQLLTIAALTRQETSIADWPDVWQYQEMLGTWRTRGQEQNFDFVLDHLTIDGGGETDYANGTSDIRANVTFGPAPEGNPYQVNDYLVDVPIPFRCRGATAELDCELDDKAAQRIVARALTGSKDTGLRRKLEEKIEEDVPEEYRDAARNLLDILGRALEQ